MPALRFALRRGTAAEWDAENPVLEAGEPGFITDENELRIGDGETPWADLEGIAATSIPEYLTLESLDERYLQEDGSDSPVRLSEESLDARYLRQQGEAGTAPTSGEGWVYDTDEWVHRPLVIGDITSLASTLAGKATSIHSHVMADVSDLSTAMALKAPLASPTFTGTVAGITSAMVGLGNVTNTSDANKPVSTAQQAALDLKANLAGPTFTGTVTAGNFAGPGTSLTGVVHTTDAETITGIKSFNPAVDVSTIGPTNLAPALSTWTVSGTAAYDAALSRITVGASGGGAFSFSTTIPGVVSGTTYAISWTVLNTGLSALGVTMAVSLGAATVIVPAAAQTVYITALASGSLTLTFSNDGLDPVVVRGYNGVTVKEVTTLASPVVMNLGDFPVRFVDTTTALATTVRPSLAIGQFTLEKLIATDHSNLAIGDYAMQNSSGTQNVAIGRVAMRMATYAASSTAVGTGAAGSALFVQSSVLVGAQAGSVSTRLNGVTAVGASAGAQAVAYTTALGGGTGASATGKGNTFVGYGAGFLSLDFTTNVATSVATTTAVGQTLVGVGARQSTTTQRDNITGIGRDVRLDGDKATALGYAAQSIHDRSVALGSETVTTAADQVHLGTRALAGATTGVFSGAVTTGELTSTSTAIGYRPAILQGFSSGQTADLLLVRKHAAATGSEASLLVVKSTGEVVIGNYLTVGSDVYATSVVSAWDGFYVAEPGDLGGAVASLDGSGFLDATGADITGSVNIGGALTTQGALNTKTSTITAGALSDTSLTVRGSSTGHTGDLMVVRKHSSLTPIFTITATRDVNIDATTIGFFGATPTTQPVANADTSGASLASLEAEVNELKAALRTLGLLAT